MTEPSPPSGIHRGWLALFCLAGGILAGIAFHDVAGLRPLLPPVLSSGSTLACQDLDAYVEQMADFSDHHFHAVMFGIHRQKTIDAVNELYDRARCQRQPDGNGHETYQKLKAIVEPDVNDPGPVEPQVFVEPPRAYPLYSHGVLVSPPTIAATAAPAAPVPRAFVTSRRRISVYGSLPRRAVAAVADDENQTSTPAGAQDPDKLAKPPRCGPDPDGTNWHRAGCP